MADGRKSTESPLNAFYAALLQGKLSLGSLGSSLCMAHPGAAMKRKPEQESSAPEAVKKQRPDQERSPLQPTRRGNEEANATFPQLRDAQPSQHERPATKPTREQAHKRSASPGERLASAWQSMDSDSADSQGMAGEQSRAEVQQEASSSKASARMSSLTAKPTTVPFTTMTSTNSFGANTARFSLENTHIATEETLPSAASSEELATEGSEQLPSSSSPALNLHISEVGIAERSRSPGNLPADDLEKSEGRLTARQSSSMQPEAAAAALHPKSPSKKAAHAADKTLTPEESVLRCLPTYFPPVENFEQTPQVPQLIA